jgi:hypothetical protein
MKLSLKSHFSELARSIYLLSVIIAVLATCLPSTTAFIENAENPLQHFPDDFYKVEGSPDIEISAERSSVYQGADTSLFLTLLNRGGVSSFEVNNEPDKTRSDEVYAAQLELDLEKKRTTAQDISVSLLVPYDANATPLEVLREVAYAGSLAEGQVSSRLEFPVEVYENTPPGDYVIYAIINYTYQQDVAVEPDSDRPQNPDIFYLYKTESQKSPMKLRVERKSGVDFVVISTSPADLDCGSKENVIRVTIENVGDDVARDVVAKLRPESGIYVSADESPIPALSPGERAELVYKVDVSKDAIASKRYMLSLVFDFSDTYRKDMAETEHFYLMLEPKGVISNLSGAVLILLLASAFLAVFVKKRRAKRS